MRDLIRLAGCRESKVAMVAIHGSRWKTPHVAVWYGSWGLTGGRRVWSPPQQRRVLSVGFGGDDMDRLHHPYVTSSRESTLGRSLCGRRVSQSIGDAMFSVLSRSQATRSLPDLLRRVNPVMTDGFPPVTE